MSDDIIIKNANVNNLKNFSVRIPRNKLVVMTGLSGSGKSSLAFDTIYAEGQRRYIESLSSYARQFLGQMDKPDVESIEGLSPAISIDQKTTSRNPRSTVGTVTEIHDYLRLLFARVGRPHCPICGRSIQSQNVDQIVDTLMDLEERTRLTIMAPVVRGRKGEHVKILERIRRDGFNRVRIDGETYLLDEDEVSLEKTFKHDIEIVVDRVVVRPSSRGRLAEAVELSMQQGDGLVMVRSENRGTGDIRENLFSSRFACPEHGASIESLEPRMFSFNSPYGACPDCNGLGYTERIDPESIIDMDKSIPEGALNKIFASMEYSGHYRRIAVVLAEEKKVDINLPFRSLPKGYVNELLYGTGERHLKYEYVSRSGKTQNRDHTFEGLITTVERRYREYQSDSMKDRMRKYMVVKKCKACEGKRLRPEVLAVTVGGKNIAEFSDMPISRAIEFMRELSLSEKDMTIAGQVRKEIMERLTFLSDVGLGYLTLSRSAVTLSGGEAQRIRLATQIGSGLQGVLYILDEPSIGLHQKDNDRLLATLRHLTDLGNTLIVVEHDEDTIRAADHIIDIGPGAGVNGGHLVCQGSYEDIKNCKESITGSYLSGRRRIPVPTQRRKGNGNHVTVRGASEHNLKNIDVDFPLGEFICVTGVSGSGKSSLVNGILCDGASKILNGTKKEPGSCSGIDGLENLDKVINIDQSPIGRTPRSNPATYTGIFTPIRDLFASLPEAKVRGFDKGRFSFNVKGGRCEACKGDGIIKIEMHFLSDVYVPCDVCHGKRYNRETLEVRYKGKNIYDVLDMSVFEALEFFKNVPQIEKKLATLNDVGLGYIKLGQPATELSGGEAQRIKLATELSKRSTGRTLYILDEPTTGLHFADVDKLLQVLQRLTDAGNSVVVIEHNMDVIKQADYIIDLGPSGGTDGGKIVVKGSPEDVARCKNSYTGEYLRRML